MSVINMRAILVSLCESGIDARLRRLRVPLFNTLSRSPRQKQKVMAMTQAIAPLTTVVQIMHCGRVLEASRSSSDMCTAASPPIIG